MKKGEKGIWDNWNAKVMMKKRLVVAFPECKGRTGGEKGAKKVGPIDRTIYNSIQGKNRGERSEKTPQQKKKRGARESPNGDLGCTGGAKAQYTIKKKRPAKQQ